MRGTSRPDDPWRWITYAEIRPLLGLKHFQHSLLKPSVQSNYRVPITQRRLGPRKVAYDVLKVERMLRAKGIPTRRGPRETDWLTPYEKEINPCPSSFLRAVRAGVVDPPSSR